MNELELIYNNVYFEEFKETAKTPNTKYFNCYSTSSKRLLGYIEWGIYECCYCFYSFDSFPLSVSYLNDISKFLIELNNRKARKENAAMKVFCYDCELEYGGVGWIEAIIPDKIWKRIAPDNGEGVLCISCISRRLAEKGFKNIPVWLKGLEPVYAVHGDFGDDINTFILRNWDVEVGDKDFDEIAEKWQSRKGIATPNRGYIDL